MISVNALFLLLLIEIAVISAGIAVYFAVRGKRYHTMYKEGMREIDAAHSAHAKLEQQVQQLKSSAGGAELTSKPAAASGTGELEELRTRISELEAQMQEKDRHQKALQAKFTDLEKEYMVLYQQQQQQALDQPKK